MATYREVDNYLGRMNSLLNRGSLVVGRATGRQVKPAEEVWESVKDAYGGRCLHDTILDMNGGVFPLINQ